LDVSNNAALTNLHCDDNQLAALDVSNNAALTYLYCGDNRLAALDVSNNAALKYLHCHGNRLAALDLSGRMLSDFDGRNQAVFLTLAESGTNYTVSVTMGTGATFDNAALSYGAGVLTSTDSTVTTSAFTSPTAEASARTLTGTLTLHYSTDPGPKSGDLDGDGNVTVGDALFTARALLGLGSLTDAQILAADVDNDGEITMADVIIIARLAAE
ncbi:MAG: dockerin type I domain-containing protein, partial [Clostridiales Family XIII bacterium]|nr:dockerin type I domain-containing protein [Clostridiales Family XIII bacterium]